MKRRRRKSTKSKKANAREALALYRGGHIKPSMIKQITGLTQSKAEKILRE